MYDGVGHRLDGRAAPQLKIARDFVPLSDAERRAYEVRLEGQALDGRFELYKTSAEHEGDVGRKQHGFPTQEEVAL